MQCLYPYPGFADSHAVYTELDWAPHAHRPFVALNMVMSVDGRATINGSAKSIGSPTDHALMMRLRAGADVILFGAGTLRADGVGIGVPEAFASDRAAHGLAPQPLLAILTASGDIPLERAMFTQPSHVVIFVAKKTPQTATARLRAHATVHIAGHERPAPGEVLRILQQEYGVRSVLCEGGPTLNHTLLNAGLLDELFLTLAPKLISGDGLSLVAGTLLAPSSTLALHSLYMHEEELYLRYRVLT